MKGDTDDDGLLDSEEVSVYLSYDDVQLENPYYYGRKYFHQMYSNPNNADTDCDGINDSIDEYPISIVTLKNCFIAYDRDGMDLYDQALWMIENEYNNLNCEIYYLHTKEDFINCWNNSIPLNVDSIHLYLHGHLENETDAVLQFYGEVMKTTPNEFEMLESKYIENKVYLNACNGGTENEYGISIAKRISERIYNYAPVEALKDGFVNYFSYFDYDISDHPKSPFDEPTVAYETNGQFPILVSCWKNYN